MKPIFQAAQEIQIYFEKKNWDFCFIGGVALQRWAIPRLTNKIFFPFEAIWIGVT